MTDVTTATTTAPAGPNALERLLKKAVAYGQNWVLHATGIGFVLNNVATHHLTKWESAISMGATIVFTTALKRFAAWVRTL